MNARMLNKVCLLSGAGSGIGRAAAELMAREGGTVVVADIDLAAAQAIAEAIRLQDGRAEAVQLDVAEETQWQSVSEVIVAKHQRLDVLVNSAGITLAKPTSECTFQEWRKVMAVNLDGTFLGTKYGMRAMTGGGSIVNIASVAGITPGGGGATAYCTSKAAIRMFSRTVAIECADNKTGIRVNTVTPAGVKTPIWDGEPFFKELVEEHGSREAAFASMEGELLSQRFYTPEEVAESILYLASDSSSHLTGTETVLNWGHTG